MFLEVKLSLKSTKNTDAVNPLREQKAALPPVMLLNCLKGFTVIVLS